MDKLIEQIPTWDDAMDDAREELGYSQDEYIEDWEGLVQCAHEWMDYYCDDYPHCDTMIPLNNYKKTLNKTDTIN